jgi:division protein CdvB (Snf7/Vps24/ESCRT-III family)
MRAKILANELANVKKLRHTTQQSSNALEALVIRFSSITELAMILDTIDPTVEMIKGIQADIAKAIPSASMTLSEMSSMTADVLSSSEVRSEVGKISTPMDAEAMNILNEIEGALETEAKAKLPEIPANMPVVHRHEEQQHQRQQQQEEQVLVEG